MAERVISTKLVLNGEKEYRAQMQAINQEYRTLDSQLKLVESSFRGQQNTLAALEAKNKALNDIIAKQAEKLKTEKDALQKNQEYKAKAAEQAEKINEKLKALNESTSEADRQTEAYQNQMSELEKALARSQAAEDAAKAAIERHTAAANRAQVNLNKLNDELEENEKYLGEARNSADGCAKSIDAMGKEAKNTEDKLEDMGQKGAEGIEALAGAIAAAGIVKTLKEIADGIMECLNASKTFESAMAGVAKTTDLSGEELKLMSGQIKELSERIPLTTSELAGIAEAGGQLGIAKENLIAFTEVMANLGAATNMTSQEAAVMLAQLTSITGTSASMYENLGSAIVALGNNFATNEKKITEMATATAAAGTNAKMSVPDILALSTAVTSLGIESLTGGSNMSKLIGDMQLAVETGKDLELWAAAAGMSAKEFATLWGENATEALLKFIGGLGTAESSAIATLDALGENDARLVRMITSLNNAEKSNGLLTRAMNESQIAWKQSIALTKEAETRYATTESKQQLLANSINNLKIAVGDQLKPALDKANEAGTGMAKWAEDFVKANTGIVPAITAVTMGVGVFAGGLTGLAAAAKLASAAMNVLNKIAMANPWMLVAAAAAAVITAVTTYALTIQETNEEVKELTAAQETLSAAMEKTEDTYYQTRQEINGLASVAGELTERLDELASKSELTAEEQAEQRSIVEQLNTMIPGLTISIDAQTGAISKSTEEIRNQTEAWKEQQIALAVAQQRQDMVKALVDAEAQYKIAEEEREERTQRINALDVQRKALLEGLARMFGTTSDALENMGRIELDNIMLAQRETLERNEQWEAARELNDGYIALTKAMDENAEEARGLIQANEESKEAFNELGKAADDARDKLGKYDDATQDIIDTSTNMPNAAERTEEALNDQAKSYDEVMKKLKELSDYQEKVRQTTEQQVESVVGGFDEIVPPVEQSVEKSIQALNSQIVYMDNYGSLVQQALDKGYKASLIAELSDGSEKSNAILQGMVLANEDQVKEMNEAWEGKLKQKAELEEELTAAKLAADEGYGALVETAQEAVNALNNEELAYVAGSETVQGLIDGLNSRYAEASAIAARYNALMRSLGNVTVSPRGAKFTTTFSHASGIDYVPEDNYPALLHKGEKVLTAAAARAQRAMDFTNYGMMRYIERMRSGEGRANTNLTINVTVQGGTKTQGRIVADEVANRLRYKGVLL